MSLLPQGPFDPPPVRVSVCMATYNGAAYVAEQVRSIVEQLEGADEMIVVDDGSKDATVDIVRGFRDPRIRVVVDGVNRGPVGAFGRALSLAQGEYVFMSDQDDVWLQGRLAAYLAAFDANPGATVVSANTVFIDREGRPVDHDSARLCGDDSTRSWRNITSILTGRTGYYGCAMAYRRRAARLLLPFPGYVESHDLWIALAANLVGENLHLDFDTLSRRLHGQNASIVSRRLAAKLWSRFIHVLSIGHLVTRSFMYRRLRDASGAPPRREGFTSR